MTSAERRWRKPSARPVPRLANLTPRERELLEQLAHWASEAKARPDSKAEALLDWLRQHVKPAGSGPTSA